MSGFGSQFRALNRAQIAQAATPPSGRSQEAIWHCVFDTQSYVSAATTGLTFFQNTNNDKTLSNMEAAAQFPSPQSFQIHNINVDIITATGVSTAATNAGSLDDVWRLLLGGRPTFTLTISSKAYGPYPLTMLHASGGPMGSLGTAIATPGSLQLGVNAQTSGWNYYGRIIIPEQVSFSFGVAWSAAQTLTGNALIRVSMSGVLNRRVV